MLTTMMLVMMRLVMAEDNIMTMVVIIVMATMVTVGWNFKWFEQHQKYFRDFSWTTADLKKWFNIVMLIIIIIIILLLLLLLLLLLIFFFFLLLLLLLFLCYYFFDDLLIFPLIFKQLKPTLSRLDQLLSHPACTASYFDFFSLCRVVNSFDCTTVN